MNKQSKKVLGIFTRYFTVLLAGAGNLYIFYKILTPISVYVLNLVLSIFADPIVRGNLIRLESVTIEIAPACVAGAAFYLLFMLFMSCADVKPSVRVKAILSAFVIFFSLNILRILALIPMVESPYFETVHWTFWHFMSTIFVLISWWVVMKLYKIDSIPMYSDVKYMNDLLKSDKNSKRKKKNK
jgi:exosortase/archaeosortase family protein